MPTRPRLIPSPDALDSRVGDETVLLHLGNSTYYGLDPVGTRIWTLLKEGHDVSAITATLLAEYDVEEAVLAADVDRLLSELVASGIVIQGDGAGS